MEVDDTDISAGGGGGGQQPLAGRRLNLLPGVRFMPTDKQLLSLYLSNRVARRPPPRCGYDIPHRNLYVSGAEPWVLQREIAFPYGWGSEFYLFTHRTPQGSGFRRTTGSGTWSAKGRDQAVRAERTGKLLGHKLMLKFVPKAKGGGGDDRGRSNWIMHEYRLPADRSGRRPRPSSSSSPSDGELVLCKIYQRGSDSEEKGCEAPAASSEDVVSSSSSSSSAVTSMDRTLPLI